MDHSLTPGPSITVMLDTVCFKAKPGNPGLAGITRRLQASGPVTVTTEEFAAAIARGQSWVGGCYQPNAKRLGWGTLKGRQVFALDFDGKPTYLDPLDALERCIRLGHKPLMLYPTFSHTLEHPRFRIVFALDRKHSSVDIAARYSRLLLRDFPEADQKCGNANRIFLGSGGKTGGEVWPCWKVFCAEGDAA